jgi:putative ABC transport system permease protein
MGEHMTEIFGLPVDTILIVLLVFMSICLLSVAYIALRQRVLMRLALRNIPRRKTQSLLIVVGLMLATVIISSALTTGDTVHFSITNVSRQSLGEVDLQIASQRDSDARLFVSSATDPMDESIVPELEATFASDPDIDAFLPVLTVTVPVVNTASNLSEPAITLTGLDPSRIEPFGGIRTVDEGEVDFSQLADDEVVVSETLAGRIDASLGDTLTVFYDNAPSTFRVDAIAEDSLLIGMQFNGDGPPGEHGMAMPLERLQELSGLEGQLRFVAVTNHGGVDEARERSAAATERLEAEVARTGLGVAEIKDRALTSGEEEGSSFVAVFLVLGLFSVAAGILLIVLIFTMLAAERRAEMGISRAVGLRQGHLIQQFLAEGAAYDLGAAAVGAAVGVGVAFIIVKILASIVGAEFEITPTFTWKSIAIAYALGVSVTFITVVFASVRASRLNIVSAIRDLPDSAEMRGGRPRWRWWKKLPRFGPKIGPFYLVTLIWLPIELLWNALIYPFRLITWLLRLIAYYIGWESLLIPGGALILLWGVSRGGESWSLALYSLGASLFAIALMLLLRRWLPERFVYTALSAIMLFYWIAPEDWVDFAIPGDLEGDFEIFFLSGVLMVTFSTLILIWNADIIVSAVALPGRVFSRWVPAVKTAIAYPLASRTRTGLTIAMFSLIIFSLVVMGTLIVNLGALFASDEADGGWDIAVFSGSSNQIGDLNEALAAEGVTLDPETVVGRVSTASFRNSYLHYGDLIEQRTVRGLDAGYIEMTEIPFAYRAEGYESDEVVWQAMLDDPRLAVLDGFADDIFLPDEVKEEPSGAFEPFEITVENLQSGSTERVTVIGFMDEIVESVAFGLYMPEETFVDVYGETPDFESFYLRLADPEVARDLAATIESTLIANGVQAFSIQEALDDEQRENNQVLALIQGFMGLGLVVGIAALGVISFRSVVERRQQIGMLRAIGYRRRMVAASFVIESVVVAGLGVVTGTALALVLSYNLLHAERFFGSSTEIGEFLIPWGQIGFFIALTLGAAIVMTFIPARSAASIPVADALRYE